MAILIILIALVVLSLLLLFLVKPGHRQLPETMRRDFAHRGLHTCAGQKEMPPVDHMDGYPPENSLSAFAKAADAGYGIELDVQLSRDGEVYVFHDYSLARMTGRNAKLSDLTSAELETLSLAGTDEKIPKLTEVLETVGGRVPLLVELKGESTDTSVCPKTDAILSAYHGDYIVESFNPLLLYWYRKNRPEVLRGQLYTNVVKTNGFSPLNLLLTGMLFNFLVKPDFIAYDEKKPGALPVRLACGLFGCARFTWTVRSPEDWTKKGGASAIFEGFFPEK